MEKSHYIIARATSFDRAEIADISHNNWNYESAPKTQAKIILDNGDIKISLTCYESSPLATYKENYDPVYLDSCMECFFNFNPKQRDCYMNVEVNSNGAILCSYGSSREQRKRVIDCFNTLPSVKISKSEQSWNANITISEDLIESAYGIKLKSGDAFIGNLYKCEQGSDKQNYLSWSPIVWEKPNFHCPEFFGTFEIE